MEEWKFFSIFPTSSVRFDLRSKNFSKNFLIFQKLQFFNFSIFQKLQFFNFSIFQNFNFSIFQFFKNFNFSIFQFFKNFNFSIFQFFNSKMKVPAIVVPEGCTEVLLHACCAPCSSAIVEWLVQHEVRPVIFYFNPNIWPREEYEIRKNESKRHAESLGLRWIDGDYDHEVWRQGVCGLEGEPERGRRCEQCFTLRLVETAKKARELGIRFFATTLASSRWKSLEQIERAGLYAQQTAPGTEFWAQNWRKGGLQERRNQLLKEYGFYNQQYCGCEFSMPDK